MADDLLGWQETRWGMTDAQIVQAVGAQNLKRVPREDGNDWYQELIIPNVEVGRYYFDVIFQMAKSSDRLVQVLIRHQGEPGKAPTGAFKAAYQMLEERFGSPARMGTAETWVWKFPTTTIFLETLFDVEIEDSWSFAFIRFVPSSRAAASEKLSAF